MIHDAGDILSTRESGRPYAGRLVRWHRDWYLLGTVYDGRKRCVCAMIPDIADATGIHGAKTMDITLPS